MIPERRYVHSILSVLFVWMCVASVSCSKPEIDVKVEDGGNVQPENELSSDITGLSDIVTAIRENEHITAINPITADDNTVGYKISFSSGKTVTLDLLSPDTQQCVSVKKDSDDIFYWTAYGEWVLDENHKKIPVGDVEPSIKTDIGGLEISFDGGKTWIAVGASENEYICGASSVSITEDIVSIVLADGEKLIFSRTELLKMCYLTDTEDLHGWKEGIFIEDGTWALFKEYGEAGGYLMSFGTMDVPDKGLIAYFDSDFRPNEIFIEDYIVRLYNYTDTEAEVAIIYGGQILETYTVDLGNLDQSYRVQTKNETLTNVANIASGILSMIDYVMLVTDGRKYASAFGGAGFVYSRMTFTCNVISAIIGHDLIPNHYVSKFLDLGELTLDLATARMFPPHPGFPTYLARAGAVMAVVAVYSDLWDTYWELYNQALDDVYGSCQVTVGSIETDGNEAAIVVNVSGYEPFGIGYLCGAAVDNSILAPDVSESTQKTEVSGNGDYSFVYSGLKYGEKYKVRPFLENTDGISLWKSFIGDWAGPLIKYGEEKTFFIARPAAETGDCSDVTENSAILDCSFSGISSKMEVGVEVTSDKSSFRFTSDNVNGASEIPVSGLEPGTVYSYCAYVDYGENIAYGEEKTFTTGLPSLAGVWVCQEKKADKDIVYTVTLHEDGTVSYTDEEGAMQKVVGSSWSLSLSGEAKINVITYSTTTSDAGVTWSGQVNDIRNPNTIVGFTYNWNYNQAGYFQGDSKSFTMRR